MATATFSSPKTRRDVVYPHAQWYFLLAIVLTWVGFARSYFAVIRTEPLLHHVHGALMGGWIALLIVQPILYQRGQLKLHRTLGRWGAFVLVPAMVVVGFLAIRSLSCPGWTEKLHLLSSVLLNLRSARRIHLPAA